MDEPNRANDTADAGPSQCARLLVIDDEESVAFTVSEVLRLEGFIVDTALSGNEAISLLQKTQYDLILTDLHMEGVNGISVLAELRRLSPLTIAIVLTGYASIESSIAAIRHGAYDYLIKPCMIDDLRLTIRRGLEHRRLILAEEEAHANLEQLNRELEQRVAERTAELERLNKDLALANQTKDVFFATLSHELRTPLTPILGWAKLLRTFSGDPAMLAQGLDAIERNAKLQTRLIDDLLDISRIVSGKLHIDVEPTDLRDIVNAAVETVSQKAEARGVELLVNLPRSSVVVVGAPVRLQQIIWNLLSNAIKFTPDGGRVEVTLASARTETRIVVTDTGEGIPPDFLPHVFGLFAQASIPSAKRHGGLGLGLAIVQRLAELHGGSVTAESEGLGKGARFTVTLPLAAAQRRDVRPEKRAEALSVDGPVLIVDDSPDTLEMMSIIFSQLGCRVLAASSAEDALTMARTEKPGIVISDI
ncbi:MAG TPA: hybrid sensor histidine kinase/response regulator, partial [Blastocatellia bacterium]|nr:hybrid sensor histidine kinase/response regulator [Blastocatellia bacterium]